MSERIIWLGIAQVCSYVGIFPEPKARKNTTQECKA